MKLFELYRPKISNRLATPAYNYFRKAGEAVAYFAEPNTSTDKRNEVVTARKIEKENMEAALKKLGWNCEAEGYFSSVWVNDNKPFVLKINEQPDRGYAHFVSVVKKHRNKHFPVISDQKEMEIAGRKYYIYMIEKLKPINYLAAAREYLNIFSKVIRFPADSLKSLFNEDNAYSYPQPPTILLDNPSLVKALRIIGNNFAGFVNDLHAGNIMQRDNGTIVIIDPYA